MTKDQRKRVAHIAIRNMTGKDARTRVWRKEMISITYSTPINGFYGT
jgi:hypothetical protein